MPQLREHARGRHHRGPRASRHRGPQEHVVRTLRERRSLGRGPGGLVHRSALPRERRLVRGEGVGLDQPRIRGHDVAGLQEQHVSRHDLSRQYHDRAPITQDAGPGCRHGAQRLQRLLGLELLREANEGVEHHDDANGHGVRSLTHQGRGHASREQQADHG